ncbi:uncharacterized protein [Bemisia tabaci]|nr:PREDICTED: uncharacterized protein LOC109041274 isoform X2 [Bemisia tabaci]XP_018913102.1 PREDICTED: uncharacterized protein LOC109041274 isoform X2 [Bemisia tabaci]
MASINIADLNLQNPVEVASKLMSQKIKENQEKLKMLQAKKPVYNFDTDKHVLKKVNIPFAEKLYQDLIDLEVKDSDVLKECSSQRLKPVPVKKDPEPNLEDFYQPNFNEEFCYKLPQYTPSLKKLREYDGYSISSKFKCVLDS